MTAVSVAASIEAGVSTFLPYPAEVNRQAIQNLFASCCGVGLEKVDDILPVEVLIVGKGGMRRHVPTRDFRWVARDVDGGEGLLQWAFWRWNADGDCRGG